jgi:hypothetical protein
MVKHIQDLLASRGVLENDDMERKLRFLEELQTIVVSEYVDMPQVRPSSTLGDRSSYLYN